MLSQHLTTIEHIIRNYGTKQLLDQFKDNKLGHKEHFTMTLEVLKLIQPFTYTKL